LRWPERLRRIVSTNWTDVDELESNFPRRFELARVFLVLLEACDSNANSVLHISREMSQGETSVGKNCTIFRKIGEANRSRIRFIFPKGYEGICKEEWRKR
jgi:hypothetical protein